MTKQLKRLNIKPIYSTRPISNSGHRFIHIIRRNSKILYIMTRYKNHSKTRSFKKLTDSLCYKFIIILKTKAKNRY